jgi:ferric-dicitrate binding protein FerR (iron transport regulator)
VHLEGQAVFDVTHDSLRPFEVRSANAITEDLGTRFTVRAYRSEARVQVFVASGKVALRAVGSPESSGTLLGPRDLGVLDSIGRTTVRNGVDSTSHLAWTRDRFVFDNAPLADVLPEIARWFDTQIDVADRELLKRRVTQHSGRSLPDVSPLLRTPQTAIRETWVAVHRIARPSFRLTATSSHQSHG